MMHNAMGVRGQATLKAGFTLLQGAKDRVARPVRLDPQHPAHALHHLAAGPAGSDDHGEVGGRPAGRAYRPAEAPRSCGVLGATADSLMAFEAGRHYILTGE
jgi:hypothetical protein